MKIGEFPDGSVCLETKENGGMEFDLVFAFGATSGDPLLAEQRKILEVIVKRNNAHNDLLAAVKELRKLMPLPGSLRLSERFYKAVDAADTAIKIMESAKL